jgi:hypothetical protein
VDAKRRIAPGENARRAGVIEVDVREDEVANVAEREATARERPLERFHTRARAAIDERGLVAGEQVRGDDLRSPEVEQVERLEVAI